MYRLACLEEANVALGREQLRQHAFEQVGDDDEEVYGVDDNDEVFHDDDDDDEDDDDGDDEDARQKSIDATCH